MNPLEIDTMWYGPSQCEHCSIRNQALFSALGKDDFSLIHEPVEEVIFSRGDLLFREDEPGSYLYTVREGVVKLGTYREGGHERIVRLLRRGDVAGLEALLGEDYQHNAVALSRTLACRIPVTVVKELSTHLPEFHRQLLNRWQMALIEAENTLTKLGVGSIKKRLARLFLHLAEQEPDSMCFIPRVEDLGAMMGVATESASRAAADLKRADLLSVVGTNRVKVDVEGIRELIG